MTNSFDEELTILDFWKKNNIFEKVKEKNKGGDQFTWVEGPPFPTGEAHLGHMRNWAIKDSVLRFRRAEGYNVYTRDGYDVHGLPVEQKVQKKLGIQDTKELKEKFGVDNFIHECRKYVSEIIDDMKGVRERYGFWLDTKQYQTSHPQYTSLAWRFFKKAQEKGLLFRDVKCVAWSPALETTLSDYEVKDTYAELEDPSVYVRFEVEKEHTTTGKKEYLLIWTTTPWTLEANQAIAINKEFSYAKVLIHDGSQEYVLIVGEPLVNQVVEKLKKSRPVESFKVLEVVEGHKLLGVKYKPLYPDNPTQQELHSKDKNHTVLHADFVSMGGGEDSIIERLEKKSFKHSGPQSQETTKPKKVVKEGTGLAHEAPAHGMEDFDLCRASGIHDAYCVVDERGLMIDESRWAGTNFRDANESIITYLTEQGAMLHSEWRKHTYPLCWRSKVPIVYRTTEQWYIKRSEYAKEIIEKNSNVRWHPQFVQQNFNNLMEDSGDWAISRQRFWGTPLPIFEDDEKDYEVIGSKEELEKLTGKELDDLHLDTLSKLSYMSPNTGKLMRHTGYTVDVWFDSGCASFASHYEEGLSFEEILKKYYLITFITESEDQIRGWFSSLFNVGYVVTGEAPYKNVLYYGFVMAKDGQKMSKSLGNGITGNEAIEKFGSDATRQYLLTKTVPEAKLNFDMDEFAIVQGYFNTLRNIFNLVSGYLDEHTVKHMTLDLNGLDIEDQWIMYKFYTTLRSFKKEMHEYRLNSAFNLVEEFMVRDFSKTYLKLIKERLDGRDDNLVTILNIVLKNVLLMQGMSSPFIAEALYQKTNFSSKKESLFLESFNEIDEYMIRKIEERELDQNFDLAQEIIQATLNAREKAKIGVRWPLGRIDLGTTDSLEEVMKPFEPLIKKLTNIHKIHYTLDGVSVDYRIKPNFATLKTDFDDVSEAIKVINLNKYHITEDLKKGESSGAYEGMNIDFEKHLIKEVELSGDLVSSEFSKGTVVLETTQDEILLEEGYLRELTRKVQQMRKEANLEKNDRISVSFENSDVYFTELVDNCEALIKKRVGADDILMHHVGDVDEMEIKGKMLRISIRKEE